LPDALKRYQEAFAGAVLYDAEVTMPGAVTQYLPKRLPPLRADVPTLVVGRAQKVPAITYTLKGSVEGTPGTIRLEVTEPVTEPELDNYFLVSMLQQWGRAQAQPALLRADRALALAYVNTSLYRDELLLSAQVALEKDNVPAALRLYQDARALAPH